MSSRLISGIAGFGNLLFGYDTAVIFVILLFLWNWLILSTAPIIVNGRGFALVVRRPTTETKREGDLS
jgi:hypothetical protein